MKIASPIVVDLGKTRRTDIEQLRECAGPLVDDVKEVMRLVCSNFVAQDENRTLFPVVVVYTKV